MTQHSEAARRRRRQVKSHKHTDVARRNIAKGVRRYWASVDAESRSRVKRHLAHGTRNSYKAGCRCEPCTDAYRTYSREYARAHRKARA